MSDFNTAHWVTARKSHVCDECSRKVEPGERYRRFAGTSDDGFYTRADCAHCAAAWGIAYSLWVAPDWWNEVTGSLRDLIRDENTEATAEGAAILAGLEVRWREPDGSLMSVLTAPTPRPGPDHTERGAS